jgi:hypothetical protein
VDTFYKYVVEFETRLGVRPGLFNELVREDDWNFVIKLHALLEACLTDAICSRLGQVDLHDIISRLDTANNQTGKLAFAKRLGILNKAQRRYVTVLSQLRNSIVHDVLSVDFNFKSHMSKLTEDQRYQFCAALSLDDMLAPCGEPGEIQLISLVSEAPKFGISCAGSVVIAEMLLHTSVGELDDNLKAIGHGVLKKTMGEISQ